jgi:hypothetical protein
MCAALDSQALSFSEIGFHEQDSKRLYLVAPVLQISTIIALRPLPSFTLLCEHLEEKRLSFEA